jgi:hypothetical protein
MTQAIKNNPEAAELYYRMVAYLFAKGDYNEALNIWNWPSSATLKSIIYCLIICRSCKK